MALNDFARRLLGYDPFGDATQGKPVSGQPANAAALAQPTLEQMYQDDLQQAQMSKLGQLGMLLMASGQQLTPAQRATILAQAPAYMDGAQKDAMTAAQARLYGMSTKAKQDEIAQQDALRQQAPALAKSLGISPELTGALTPEQIREMYIKKQMADPRESQLMDLKIAEEQARIDALRAPKAGPAPQLIDLPDGRKGWAVPGQTDITPINGAGKGSADPEMAKKTDGEGRASMFATQAIEAFKTLAQPRYSTALTSRMQQAGSYIPNLKSGGTMAPDYRTASQAASGMTDAILRDKSGATINDPEIQGEISRTIPLPGDLQSDIQRKILHQVDIIDGFIGKANPADRPALRERFSKVKEELMAGVSQGDMPSNTGNQMQPRVLRRIK